MPSKHDPLRRFIMAALCDLIGYLDELEDPIIVGKRYSKELLVGAFSDWCKIRNITLGGAEAKAWLSACSRGAFATSLEDKNDSAE